MRLAVAFIVWLIVERKEIEAMTKQILTFAATVLFISLCTSTGVGKGRKMQRVPEGTWGGLHLRMEVVDGSATIEYDCANGTIAGPLTIDRRGRFSLRGTHAQEHGGPIRNDEKPNSRPARYTGWTDGRKMTLTVTLTDTNETLGTFSLVRGQQGRVFKCR